MDDYYLNQIGIETVHYGGQVECTQLCFRVAMVVAVLLGMWW